MYLNPDGDTKATTRAITIRSGNANMQSLDMSSTKRHKTHDRLLVRCSNSDKNSFFSPQQDAIRNAGEESNPGPLNHQSRCSDHSPTKPHPASLTPAFVPMNSRTKQGGRYIWNRVGVFRTKGSVYPEQKVGISGTGSVHPEQGRYIRNKKVETKRSVYPEQKGPL